MEFLVLTKQTMHRNAAHEEISAKPKNQEFVNSKELIDIQSVQNNLLIFRICLWHMKKDH